MTLRHLWLMAAGRREEWRSMLLGQGWVIDQLFNPRGVTESRIERFLKTGTAGACAEVKEPRNEAVDRKVAEILANDGKLIVG